MNMKVQWRKITRVKYCPLDYEKIQLFYATVYSNRSISIFKLRLSPSKKFVFVCFNKSPFKMMKNVFLFLVKSPFLSGDIYIFSLEIFTFFIWRYLHFLSGDIYIFYLEIFTFFIWRYLHLLSGDICIFYLEIFTFFIWRYLHFLSGDIYTFVLIFWLCRKTAEKESYN